MKWFKHMVDSGDDPDIVDAMKLYGDGAYYIFFRILEIMSREFDIDKPGVNIFSQSFIETKLNRDWNVIEPCLAFYRSRKRIFWKRRKNATIEVIRLNCPKLKDSCDQYTEKLLRTKYG